MSVVVFLSASWPLARFAFCWPNIVLHVLEAQAEAVQKSWIHFHAHRRQRAAANVDLADALNLQKPLLNDRGGGVVKLAAIINVGGQRNNHDRRVGGIDFAIRRIAGKVRGQIRARGVDRRLNVARRAVDVAIQIKLQRDGTSNRACSTKSFRSRPRCGRAVVPAARRRTTP